MKKYKIIFEKAAEKFMRKQDRPTQERLLRTIYKLPEGSDIKHLRGSNDLYRVRVGDMRVIYRIDDDIKIIWIENINNRGDVYKGLLL